MRRTLMVVTLVTVAMLATPARAATLDATDLAADCDADGRLDVTGVQRYVGGVAALSGDCSVVMMSGATLVLRGVELTGSGNLVAISSPERTTIKVINSSIVVAGFLELTAGCCAGDLLVPEYGGTVIVRNSVLSGRAVQLLASFDWPRGRVEVANSTIVGSGSLGVQIRASDLGGTKGRVTVIDSTVSGGGDVLIRTGTKGRTVVRTTTFDAAGDVIVASGTAGRCRTWANSPAVTCS